MRWNLWLVGFDYAFKLPAVAQSPAANISGTLVLMYSLTLIALAS
jgi:hypothetical protein